MLVILPFRTPGLLHVYRKIGATYNLPLLIERLGERGREASPSAVGSPGDMLVARVLSMSPGVPIADWQAAYEKMLRCAPAGCVTADHPPRVLRRRDAKCDVGSS